jgi:hypothetical protein
MCESVTERSVHSLWIDVFNILHAETVELRSIALKYVSGRAANTGT